jgi:hypothetical protein
VTHCDALRLIRSDLRYCFLNVLMHMQLSLSDKTPKRPFISFCTNNESDSGAERYVTDLHVFLDMTAPLKKR